MVEPALTEQMLPFILARCTLERVATYTSVLALYPADTLMVYFMETYHGSSGSPVLIIGFEGSKLGAVHRLYSMKDKHRIGSIVNENFVASLRHVALKMLQIQAVLTRYAF